MKLRPELLIAILCGSSVFAYADAENPDPTYTVVTYVGSGTAEERPTIGTAFFSFSVDCLGSAEAVREAIGAESDDLWEEITQKVPAVFTETQARFFGATGNIQERPGWRYETTPPRFDPQNPSNVIPAVSQFVDVCTNKPIDNPKEVGTVFSGARVFGARTQDLTWLEDKILELNKKSSRADRGRAEVRALGGRLDPVTARPVEEASRRGEAVDADVTVVPGTIAYSVPKTTLQRMLAETRKEAKAQAEESLDSDIESLGLEHRVPLKRQVAVAPFFRAVIGAPIARGQAPKVTLKENFFLRIFLKAAGLKNSEGEVSTFPASAEAAVDADYADLTVEFSTRCHADKADPVLKLLEEGGVAPTRLGELRDYQKEHGDLESVDPESEEAKAHLEKNRLEVELIQGPFEELPYRPLAYDVSNPKFPVTQYLNTCTLEAVPAPPSGKITDLPKFWRASQTATLRSEKFEQLLDQSEKLQNELDKSQTARDVVFTTTSDPIAGVIEATQRKLERLARADAIGQVLAAPLPDALAEDSYVEAYFRSLDPEGFFGFESAGPVLASAADASASNTRDSLEAEVVIRDDERPLVKMVRHYAYSWEVQSQNYAQATEDRAVRGRAQVDSTAQSRVQERVRRSRARAQQ